MVDLIIFLTLLTLGFLFGRWAEKSHFKSIIDREEKLHSILTFSERLPPADIPAKDSTLVSGNVVVSVDFFKNFVAGLRGLIGGRMTSYESLVERARREAILRMKQEAADLGATHIFNVKIETSSISKNAKQSVGSVEVYAYGTALLPDVL